MLGGSKEKNNYDTLKDDSEKENEFNSEAEILEVEAVAHARAPVALS